MEELRVSKLLAGALAAVTGAAVASAVGFEGTLAGAAMMSVFMAVTTAGYGHSLAFAHGRMRQAMVRALERPEEGCAGCGTPPVEKYDNERVPAQMIRA
jgi:hypothetical protein